MTTSWFCEHLEAEVPEPRFTCVICEKQLCANCVKHFANDTRDPLCERCLDEEAVSDDDDDEECSGSAGLAL